MQWGFAGEEGEGDGGASPDAGGAGHPERGA